MSTALSPTTFVDTKKAACQIGLSETYLCKLRVIGGGPTYSKVGRAVRYRVQDLEDFMSGRAHTSTSSYGVADAA